MDFTDQAQATGGGLHGRLILIADHDTLPPAVLDHAVRDLLANLISVAQANAATLHAFREIRAVIQDPEMLSHLLEAIAWSETFLRLHDEVAMLTRGTAPPDENLSRMIAARAREWAWSGIIARDAATLAGARLMEAPLFAGSAP